MANSTRTVDLPLTEDLLQEIRRRIVHTFAPVQVILFGSYAEKRATVESDLDLLVVTEQPVKREERIARMQGLFQDLPLPVQVITISRTEFEESRDVIGGIAYPAAKYGSVIYEKSCGVSIPWSVPGSGPVHGTGRSGRGKASQASDHEILGVVPGR